MTDDIIETVLDLDRTYPTVLGMGAHLKASLCLVEGDKAYLTKTAGDMETLEAVELYEDMLGQMLERAGGADNLAATAHDLHKDFHSTQFAEALGRPALPVQHHHAHIVCVAEEHGHKGPLLGLALDGFGLGPGDESWGGELLVVDGHAYDRFGHLSRLAQPGGDIAAREPWRMGAAALHALGHGREIAERFAHHPHAAMLDDMMSREINSPVTSSCGRLFDAACGLLGVHEVAEFEGQAPMGLEALATAPTVMEGDWHVDADGMLDVRPLLLELVGMETEAGANLFHGTLSRALTDWVLQARERTGLNTVGFGGGCFFNKVVRDALVENLTAEGMTVLVPQKLSPGDAGLSFGQAMCACLALEDGQL